MIFEAQKVTKLRPPNSYLILRLSLTHLSRIQGGGGGGGWVVSLKLTAWMRERPDMKF